MRTKNMQCTEKLLLCRRVYRGKRDEPHEADEDRHLFRAMRVHDQEKFDSYAVPERADFDHIRSRSVGILGIFGTTTYNK